VIYVEVEGLKEWERGSAGGNGWHDTDDVAEAVRVELARFHRMWDGMEYGAVLTYTITVATENSPRRTTTGAPLPVHPRTPVWEG
jgi:hypothetical protein